MSDSHPAIDELFEDGRAIDEALMEAARDARRFHKANEPTTGMKPVD